VAARQWRGLRQYQQRDQSDVQLGDCRFAPPYGPGKIRRRRGIAENVASAATTRGYANVNDRTTGAVSISGTASEDQV
jgi:hypothetical protein